jgi:hypothetical protein
VTYIGLPVTYRGFPVTYRGLAITKPSLGPVSEYSRYTNSCHTRPHYLVHAQSSSRQGIGSCGHIHTGGWGSYCSSRQGIGSCGHIHTGGWGSYCTVIASEHQYRTCLQSQPLNSNPPYIGSKCTKQHTHCAPCD